MRLRKFHFEDENGREWTLIYTEGFVKYARLQTINIDLVEIGQITEYIAISGRQPCWWAIALALELKDRAKAIAVYRPFAAKFMIIWAKDPALIGVWITPPKKIIETIKRLDGIIEH